ERMSSARISASVVFPKLVRSPHSSRTSAFADTSPNSSRYGLVSFSWTWRSPMAATRSLRSVCTVILLFEIADGLRKAPLIDIDRIVARAEDAAAADLLARAFHRSLVAQPLQKFFKQPWGDHVALARVDEAEIEKRD